MQELIIMENVNRKNWEVYKAYLTSKAISNKETVNTTYRTYFNNVKLFFQYLKQCENNRYVLSEDTQRQFIEIWERYVMLCISQGNNNQTIRNKRTAVSTFLDWCEKRDLIKLNPFRKIEQIKITESDKRRKSYFLNQKQIYEINFVMKYKEKEFDIQDRLIFNLFLDSAVRISAGHSLKLSQLDLDNRCFRNVRHKEGYIKPVIFFEDTREILIKWVREREKLGIDLDWLFVTKYNGRYKQMSKETIRARVRKMGKIVGIDNYYPHSIRKTIINIISGAGTVSDGAMLGYHKDTKVTSEHYIREKEEKEVKSRLLELRRRAGLD